MPIEGIPQPVRLGSVERGLVSSKSIGDPPADESTRCLSRPRERAGIRSRPSIALGPRSRPDLTKHHSGCCELSSEGEGGQYRRHSLHRLRLSDTTLPGDN